tara:strand:- start:242 stop:952 length:711 start_codon:yes stop_codon:yes gene_type:complete
MIEAKNISRTVNSKVLFHEISFSLPNKKITGLLGANGAGKTSLFKALAGLTKIDSGHLSFFGQNLNDMTLEKRSNSGLNFVPQENSLFDELSIRENIEAVLELKFKKISNEKAEQMDILLKKLNLHEKQDVKTKFLSGGEKRKTEILRSIVLDSKFILLDEPFAGVDPISVEEIIKILKDFKKDIGIFISDHNFRDVMNVCDEIILLNQGEVFLTGTPEEVKNDPVAKKLYFGELI